MNKYKAAVEIAKSEGLDILKAENTLTDFFQARVGSVIIFDSAVPGVMAFERIDAIVGSNKMADDLADHLTAETGIPVICIANCDWSFDDACDEEATLVAFDIPSLPEDYRDDPRNQIEPRERPSIAPAL